MAQPPQKPEPKKAEPSKEPEMTVAVPGTAPKPMTTSPPSSDKPLSDATMAEQMEGKRTQKVYAERLKAEQEAGKRLVGRLKDE